MNLKKMLQIGEKIEVRYYEGAIDSEKRSCYSMIQDMISQDELVITIPMVKGNQIILPLGQEVEIVFFRDEGQYIFKAKIEKRFKKENVDLLKLNRISSIKRIQRRNYYRLNITLPISIKLLTDKDKQSQNFKEWLKTYTMDISGGGVRILLDRNIEKGSLLECKLKINDEDLLLKGEVVRSQLIQQYPITKYEIGISFVDITEYQRDQIIGFIFEEQRKLRRKGFI